MNSSQVLKKKINHIAIIMDGNGRWSLKRKVSKKIGHEQGVKNCINICKNLDKIDYRIVEISFYVFSTENWSRSKSEINNLFRLIDDYYSKFRDVANENNLIIRHYGSKRRLSKKLINIIDEVTIRTHKNTGTFINLMFNYGSRQELVNAFKKISINKKRIITEKLISNNLYTKNIPDPEILIRTGNTNRLSNFLLWQINYTEIFFVKKLWPDFNKNDFNKILNKFNQIKRNFGAI